MHRGAHAFPWSLSVKQAGNIIKADKQIVKDIDLDNGVKGILDAHKIALKIIYGNSFSVWVCDPIFAYPEIFVIIKLADVIIGRVAGGDDLNDEVRRAVAALSIQLILVTDNHNIGLDNCKGLFGQHHIKRGAEYLAGAFPAFDIAVNDVGQFHGERLVCL